MLRPTSQMRTALLVAAVTVAAGLALNCGGATKPTAVPTVARASASVAPSPPPGLTASDVDQKLEAAWKANGLSPTAKVDDGRWLRRVTIDVVGTLPTADKTRAFLADTRPDKRERAIDELLASPAYAEHWAFYWDDELMARGGRYRTMFDLQASRFVELDEHGEEVVYDTLA